MALSFWPYSAICNLANALNGEQCVIISYSGGSGEPFNSFKDRIVNLRCRAGVPFAECVGQSGSTEFLVIGIRGLSQAIGIEDES